MQTYAVTLLQPLFLKTRDQLSDESQGLSSADVLRFVGGVDVDLESEVIVSFMSSYFDICQVLKEGGRLTGFSMSYWP
jgi:hypothetical protein